jgi:hypothetical protein
VYCVGFIVMNVLEGVWSKCDVKVKNPEQLNRIQSRKQLEPNAAASEGFNLQISTATPMATEQLQQASQDH